MIFEENCSKSDESKTFTNKIKNPNEVFAPTGVKHLRNKQWETGQEKGVNSCVRS